MINFDKAGPEWMNQPQMLGLNEVQELLLTHGNPFSMLFLT